MTNSFKPVFIHVPNIQKSDNQTSQPTLQG